MPKPAPQWNEAEARQRAEAYAVAWDEVNLRMREAANVEILRAALWAHNYQQEWEYEHAKKPKHADPEDID